MHKQGSGRSSSCLVSKYIGSDFDKVDVVASNIEAVTGIADGIDGIKFIQDNEELLNEIYVNLDTIPQYQLYETHVLSKGQTQLQPKTVIPTATEVFVSGQAIDDQRLVQDEDFTISGDPLTVTLKRSYPEGTVLAFIHRINKELKEIYYYSVINGDPVITHKITNTSNLSEYVFPFTVEWVSNVYVGGKLYNPSMYFYNVSGNKLQFTPALNTVEEVLVQIGGTPDTLNPFVPELRQINQDVLTNKLDSDVNAASCAQDATDASVAMHSATQSKQTCEAIQTDVTTKHTQVTTMHSQAATSASTATTAAQQAESSKNAVVTLLSGMGHSNTFDKANVDEPIFYMSGGRIRTSSQLVVAMGGILYTIPKGELVTDTVYQEGQPYRIYFDGSGLFCEMATTPRFTDTSAKRYIGGFSYGSGAVKQYSFYDLKFRPRVSDCRNMVIDPSMCSFWSDIYLLNTDPSMHGTSSYNQVIARGDTPITVPPVFGSMSRPNYPNLSYTTAGLILQAYGKRLPSEHEFYQLAIGSTVGHAVGTAPTNTGHVTECRSMIGCEQVTGCYSQWGNSLQTVYAESFEKTTSDLGDSNREGLINLKGTSNNLEAVAIILGGHYAAPVINVGAAAIDVSPLLASQAVAVRGICDHLQLL